MSYKTALYDEHVKLGGKIVDFAGWQMPVQYEGVLAEHEACRKNVALFDVSHMGEIDVVGPDACAFIDYLTTNQCSKLEPGQAQYSLLCNEDGGTIDDIIVYCLKPQIYLLVVNAANTAKDWEHIRQTLEENESDFPKVKLKNSSSEYSQLALQGPEAESVLQRLVEKDLSTVKSFHFFEAEILKNIKAIVSRTGYTGEDGFEIYTAWKDGPSVWRALLGAGRDCDIKPAGLGARDSLRIEARLPLYGQELSDEASPLEAGLGWAIKLDKKKFIGRQPLEYRKSTGLVRKLVGIEMVDRGIPRQGYTVWIPKMDEPIGRITSGTHSPTLNKAIGIANLEVEHAEIGTSVFVEIRGNRVEAKVVETPFYRRKK